MPDKKQTQPKTGLDAEQEPKTAPEVTDKALLTNVQKQKIEADFELDPNEVPAASPPTPPSGEDDGNDETPSGDTAKPKRSGNWFKRFFAGYWRHKRWTILLTIVVILGGLAGVPYTRYWILGHFISKNFSVHLVDAKTGEPISGATLRIESANAKTDAKGNATLKAKVGKHNLDVDKKYYKTYTSHIFVGLSNQKSTAELKVEATGRQVPVTVTNKITGKPLEGVTLKSVGTEVKTDKDGKATIVLPADKPDLPISLSNGGYNNLEARVQVTDQAVKENTFTMVPSGQVYFLSRLSGKIDVVKTDLDGGSRQTVIAGTGKEEDANTVLLASRDWKYLALLSKRDSGLAKLYLIDTSTDKMTEMDSGDAAFTLVGWSNHNFVYRVNRNATQYWQANHLALKSYNAEKKQLLTIDQTAAEGPDSGVYYQSFDNQYLVNDKLVYTVTWNYYSNSYYNPNMAGRTHSLRVASVDAVSKKDVKTWPADQFSSYFIVRPYEPQALYVGIYSNAANKLVYYEYEDDAVKDSSINDSDFNSAYSTYLQSPDGKQTFWTEQRDGRNAFFVGTADGKDGKQIATLDDDAQVFGWYGSDYLLLSKKSSELYIVPVAGTTPFKVSDYHKPQLTYRGYGGGYGGL